jgi:uncharacterized heparinase superfamily protein
MGQFQSGQKGQAAYVRWGCDAGTCWFAGSHDGYRRLPGRVLHRREWRLDPTGLQIRDRLDGQFKSAQAVFHLHPAVTAAPAGESATRLSAPGRDGIARLETSPATPFASAPSAWYPEFGATEPATVLTVPFGEGGALATHVYW